MTDDNRKLYPGMLLLGGMGGVEGEELDRIWTVKSAGKTQATLVAYEAGVSVTATLTTNGLPAGWRALNGRWVAQVVREALS